MSITSIEHDLILIVEITNIVAIMYGGKTLQSGKPVIY